MVVRVDRPTDLTIYLRENTMRYEIYALRNLIQNRIVYVGQTTKGLVARMDRHRQHALDPGQRLIAQHIYEFGFNNFNIELLHTCDSQEEADAAEEVWIRHHSTLTPTGCNVWSGSVRGSRPEHINKKVSKKLMGHSVSDETRGKIREARAKQAPMDAEARAKISKVHKGKKLSAEQRQKLVEAWKIRRLKK